MGVDELEMNRIGKDPLGCPAGYEEWGVESATSHLRCLGGVRGPNPPQLVSRVSVAEGKGARGAAPASKNATKYK